MTYRKELIKHLAAKHDLTQAQVEYAVNYQFKFLRHVMTNDVDRGNFDFPTINLIGLGKFYVPGYVVDKLRKYGKQTRYKKED